MINASIHSAFEGFSKERVVLQEKLNFLREEYAGMPTSREKEQLLQAVKQVEQDLLEVEHREKLFIKKLHGSENKHEKIVKSLNLFGFEIFRWEVTRITKVIVIVVIATLCLLTKDKFTDAPGNICLNEQIIAADKEYVWDANHLSLRFTLHYNDAYEIPAIGEDISALVLCVKSPLVSKEREVIYLHPIIVEDNRAGTMVVAFKLDERGYNFIKENQLSYRLFITDRKKCGSKLLQQGEIHLKEKIPIP